MSKAPNQSDQADRPLGAIILAAGLGKRMNSDLPKVVHAVAGKPMVRWVVEACRAAGADPIVLVIGHGGNAVRDIFAGDDADLRYVVQDKQLGTGHAALCAKPVLKQFTGDLLVLAGDGPLIRVQTVQKLLRSHRTTQSAATLATSVIADPTGYGRILRDSAGRFDRIVEHRDATAPQREIREVNPSYYCFQAAPLMELLSEVKNENASGEYYLIDVLPVMKQRGLRVEVVDAVPQEDVLSINDPQQLAEVDTILRQRLAASRHQPTAEVHS